MSALHPVIAGLGAGTPIGRTVWSCAAAARAGICGFAEHPYMIDTAGEPMCVAAAPWLDVDSDWRERLATLLVPALREALAPLTEAVAGPDLAIGLALALPAPRPGVPEDLSQQMVARVGAELPDVFSRLETFGVGHAGGHLALERVMRDLEAGVIDAGLVAGVDSYLDVDTLEWLEACDQLHGAGPMNNAWGFIPGEGAGAVLILSNVLARRLRLDVLGAIVGLGIARESSLIKTEDVCVGEGLTRAFRAALASLPSGSRIDNVFCDLNGETYRADEYGFTALRTAQSFRSATDFVAPADCWGDVGAAGAPLHAALALIANRKRYARGPLSMVWASSESGERGALILRGLDPVAR